MGVVLSLDRINRPTKVTCFQKPQNTVQMSEIQETEVKRDMKYIPKRWKTILYDLQMETLLLLTTESVRKKCPRHEAKEVVNPQKQADRWEAQDAVLGKTWGRRLLDLTAAKINQSTLILGAITSWVRVLLMECKLSQNYLCKSYLHSYWNFSLKMSKVDPKYN